MDCGDLVSELREKAISEETLDELFDYLWDGVMTEVEVFVRMLLKQMADTMEEQNMVKAEATGLSSGSQQAKSSFLSGII